jgi:heptosyltransferase III
VVLSGGQDAEEVAYCATLAAAWPGTAYSLAGQASFATLARLLSAARCYIGPDTSTTHLAAAAGTPTLAMFGPSNPVKWGPWPRDCRAVPSPWVMRAQPWQLSGNVLLLQGEGECVPCREEGCDRHRDSESRCLTGLAPATVIAALDALLAAT